MRATCLRWLVLLMSMAALSCSTHEAAPPTEIVVYAAGSLRSALTEVAQSFEAREPAVKVRFVFGASGLLKDRLLSGEQAEVFASANTEHPQALAAAGRGGPVAVFALNRLCVLAAPGVDIDSAHVIDRLFDPAVRVGTSTPVADPSGDYTWALFRNIDRVHPGAFARLDRKALKLTGGVSTAPPPAEAVQPAPGARPVVLGTYATLLAQGKADVFITYCTVAQQARAELPTLRVVELPAEVNVAASYGIVRLKPGVPMARGKAASEAAEALGRADQAGQRFIASVLGLQGRAVLGRFGFALP